MVDHVGNVLMKHQLWATGLTFAMFGVEKGIPVDQFIMCFPGVCSKNWSCRCCISWMSRSCFTLLRTSSFAMKSIPLIPRIIL